MLIRLASALIRRPDLTCCYVMLTWGQITGWVAFFSVEVCRISSSDDWVRLRRRAVKLNLEGADFAVTPPPPRRGEAIFP